MDRYIINPKTLMAELQSDGSRQWWKWLLVLLSGVAILLLYVWVSVSLLGADLPKTAILKHRNADWTTRMDQMSGQLDRCEELLSMLEVRDNKIYRSVYGMDEIPQAVRLSGFGGENRYEDLEGTSLSTIVPRLDILEKRAYIQSRSFDDVSMLQKTAGDMAAHIPAIPPMSTEKGSFHLSSPFGFRSDPLNGSHKRHTGMDFACPPGNPIYATGDGIVTKVAHERTGYGNHVIIDHGFGYKTRYAHMRDIEVEQGQKVSRGDFIGHSGRSGRCTGPHLHYEVLYRKDYANPALYMDLDISPKDYFEIAKKPAK
ncbi:MAG: M23 family metallopeptidase [Bacteroidales bacterium]|nr:M23 family metallopeptidase [Bacteroidales bacterium]